MISIEILGRGHNTGEEYISRARSEGERGNVKNERVKKTDGQAKSNRETKKKTEE